MGLMGATAMADAVPSPAPDSFQALHATPLEEAVGVCPPRLSSKQAKKRTRSGTKPTPARKHQRSANSAKPKHYRSDKVRVRRSELWCLEKEANRLAKRQRVFAHKEKRAHGAKERWQQWEELRDDEALLEAKRAVLSKTMHCRCVECRMRQRDSQEMPYKCPVFRCKQAFNDFVPLFEHQLASHGTIFPACQRVCTDLYGLERGGSPMPPMTVYVGQQFLAPWQRPVQWTMADAEKEMATLHERLTASRHVGRLLVWRAFKLAFSHLEQGGETQLNIQYRMAIEHYNSSLSIPVRSRTFHDGTNHVGPGRNWLISSAQVDPTLTVRLTENELHSKEKDDVDEEYFQQQQQLMEYELQCAMTAVAADEVDEDADEDAEVDAALRALDTAEHFVDTAASAGISMELDSLDCNILSQLE
ncbi:TPA: hypothetical protein N0F65_001314 [Lagenidium giganteum]|uniref:C2H2-type domain-containing protein n=1 Tax=Lagenidium giganteum TaxID=4803 RepID=A0AAV2Z0G1_9STRA|nr:TPA: hypothetical protein N0F65_001314 [Lagenidium giganteum]